MLMINELIFRQALVEGQIVPYFQPQFHLKTGRVSGFEALARWEHPEYGVVLPSAFIPLAERIWIDGGVDGGFICSSRRGGIVVARRDNAFG
jgi:EAL domain-containing protein (putative c-di-GMP-specific phosphodiesterase class I)